MHYVISHTISIFRVFVRLYGVICNMQRLPIDAKNIILRKKAVSIYLASAIKDVASPTYHVDTRFVLIYFVASLNHFPPGPTFNAGFAVLDGHLLINSSPIIDTD